MSMIPASALTLKAIRIPCKINRKLFYARTETIKLSVVGGSIVSQETLTEIQLDNEWYPVVTIYRGEKETGFRFLTMNETQTLKLLKLLN